MVVQHNLQAMNANRMLNGTTKAQGKSTEKLSSGYKINRAADDAAGLAISEKMRKQIRGLDQASSNAEDGVSCVQTAEGALTEVQDMIQRMNELAVQAANGTNSQSDRESIQNEITELNKEIDRVAETTKFNETLLLKGNGHMSTHLVNAHDAGLAGELVDNLNGSYNFTANKISVGDTVTIAGTNYNIVNSSDPSEYTSIKGYTPAAGDTITRDGKQYTFVAASGITPAGKTAGADGWFADDNTGTGADFTNLKAGDVLYVKASQKTTTLVGNTTLTMDTAAVATPTWAKGDTLTQDGVTYTYVPAGQTTPANMTAGTAGWFSADNGTVTPNTVTASAGDTYVIKTTGYEGTIDNAGITTIQNLQEMIRGAAVDDTFLVKDSANDVGTTYTVKASSNGNQLTADDIAALVKDGTYVTDKNGKTYYAVPAASESVNDIDVQTAYAKMAKELAVASSIGATNPATVVNHNDGTFTITQGSNTYSDALSFNLHVGSDATMSNKITININVMNSDFLGINGLDVVGKDDKGYNINDGGTAATYAIDAISDALRKVSEQRALLGAAQNRLEHTISNLDNVVENTTAAESRIRDTDMAEEMVEYSKNNILMQAGQSMLAQANQSTQGVLSLLQG